MFAGDTESIYSFEGAQPSPIEYLDSTRREHDFGWSANVSGIRAGRDKRRIRREEEFERQFEKTRSRSPQLPSYSEQGDKQIGNWKELENEQATSTRRQASQRHSTFLEPSPLKTCLDRKDSGGAGLQASKVCKSTNRKPKRRGHLRSESWNDCGVRLTKPNNEKLHHIVGLANEDKVSVRKSWMNKTDEVLYALSRRSNHPKSHPDQMMMEAKSKRMSGLPAKNPQATSGSTSSGEEEAKPALRKLVKRLSRRFTMEDKYRTRVSEEGDGDGGGVILSHQMVGSASPYPVRPPLPGFVKLSISDSKARSY